MRALLICLYWVNSQDLRRRISESPLFLLYKVQNKFLLNINNTKN